MNLGSLVVKFPGLIYPDKSAISPAGLIGYLEKELKAHPQYEMLRKMAEAALPQPKEQH